MKNKHAGSLFDDFLAEEGIETVVAARAAKKTFVHQLTERMIKAKKNKSAFRKALNSPATTERLFNDNVGISLETMARAAAVVNCDIDIRIVKREKPVELRRKVAGRTRS